MQKVVRGTRIDSGLIPRIETLIPVIGYIRVSTWREEAISDEIQMAAITEATARAGRTVTRWITDLDATGRNFKRRIMEAITAVEDHEVPEIWVWKFSRFGRSRHGVAINLARIETVGGELRSATEHVDASTATGEFTRDMLFAVAAFESNRAGEQWRETHELRRLAGVPAAGGKRFGYKWFPRRIPDGEGGWATQDERYEVDPTPAEAWADAYQAYSAGTTGFGRIAAGLNDAGFATTRGTRWSNNTVTRAMDGGFAAGLLYVHRTDVRCGKRGACQKWAAHWAYRPAEHEAILTGEEWDAYRDRRTARKATPRRSLTPVYPMSGLTRCFHCHGAAVVHTGAPRTNGVSRGVSYICRPRAQHAVEHPSIFTLRPVVESAVYDWLVQISSEVAPQAAEAEIVQETSEQADAQRHRARLTAEVAELNAALDRATEGNILGHIPLDSYQRTRDRLLERRRQRQAALDGLPAVETGPQGGVHEHHETVAALIDGWDDMAVSAKRVLLATVIRRVEIGGPGRVRVVPSWAPADT
jgi:DNA invertase Pin-like site-specific DNA recombinase/DNA-binding GntR family transcriptional regulator